MDADQIALVKKLAEVCRNEGVRRVRVGDIELELAVVRNPLAEEKPALRVPTEEKPDKKPGEKDWQDAFGGPLPVKRRSS